MKLKENEKVHGSDGGMKGNEKNDIIIFLLKDKWLKEI